MSIAHADRKLIKSKLVTRHAERGSQLHILARPDTPAREGLPRVGCDLHCARRPMHSCRCCGHLAQTSSRLCRPPFHRPSGTPHQVLLGAVVVVSNYYYCTCCCSSRCRRPPPAVEIIIIRLMLLVVEVVVEYGFRNVVGGQRETYEEHEIYYVEGGGWSASGPFRATSS